MDNDYYSFIKVKHNDITQIEFSKNTRGKCLIVYERKKTISNHKVYISMPICITSRQS